MRSSGVPVSYAAGCPRRCAPRRPLNANVEAVEKPFLITTSGAKEAYSEVERTLHGQRVVEAAPARASAQHGRYYSRLLRRIPVLCELLDVVHKTEELPLRIDLGATAQREAIEALVVSQIAEDRLHSAEAHGVAGATFGRIDPLLHTLGV